MRFSFLNAQRLNANNENQKCVISETIEIINEKISIFFIFFLSNTNIDSDVFIYLLYLVVVSSVLKKQWICKKNRKLIKILFFLQNALAPHI